MSMITEQVERMRRLADEMEKSTFVHEETHFIAIKVLREAANTISVLSEKLQAANMEKSTAYYNGGWIPVKERLPEDGRPVLIYAWSVHDVIARYDELRTEEGYKKAWVTADAWNGNTEIKHDVIAWMPLPEPYREDGDME